MTSSLVYIITPTSFLAASKSVFAHDPAPNCESTPKNFLNWQSTWQGLGVEEQAVLIQCICLKMLTDFTLMYTAAIGLVLRQDSDFAVVKNSPRAKTPGKAPKQVGVLLRLAV